MNQWELREMAIAEIRTAEYNPRVALCPGDSEYEKLKRSIETLGIVDPLVWNKQSETLVGGHQRLTVLRDLGYDTVPCWVVDLSPEQEREANIALNKIEGRWDKEKLIAVLEGLKPEEVAVAGFDARDLRALYEDDTATVKDDKFDVGASFAAHEKPRTKRGDVIQLGRHRLMCGDATSESDAARLFGDKLASMIFTDPPYNVDYHGSNGKSIMNDKMSDSGFYRFLLDAFSVMYSRTAPGGAIYVCHADTEGLNFRSALTDSGFLLKQVLVWVKNSIVLGRQDYQWQHEPILYGWKPGASHHWCGDRKQSTVIRPNDILTVEEDKNGFILSFNVGFECVRMRVPSFDVLAKTEGSSVWLFDKPTVSKEHPTMKPIDLCARAIRNSSERGEIVGDLFGGSGSTLVACEQLGRTCYTMELDPRYCDVIRDRYEKISGGGVHIGMTERQYKTRIVERMKALDVYREEFIPTIDRLAALYCHRDKIEAQFAASGGDAVIRHTNKAGATNAIKNPFLTARDEVYTQLLAHERELGLTPAALKRLNEASLKPKKSSAFAEALKALSD